MKTSVTTPATPTEIIEKLTKGEESVELTNENNFDLDETKIVEISFVADPRHSWRNGFHMWDGGQKTEIIKTKKTLERRLGTLIKKHSLELSI